MGKEQRERGGFCWWLTFCKICWEFSFHHRTLTLLAAFYFEAQTIYDWEVLVMKGVENVTINGKGRGETGEYSNDHSSWESQSSNKHTTLNLWGQPVCYVMCLLCVGSLNLYHLHIFLCFFISIFHLVLQMI